MSDSVTKTAQILSDAYDLPPYIRTKIIKATDVVQEREIATIVLCIGFYLKLYEGDSSIMNMANNGIKMTAEMYKDVIDKHLGECLRKARIILSAKALLERIAIINDKNNSTEKSAGIIKNIQDNLKLN